ncbi:MAG: PEGA domain-containing protein [Patescibacteria group bacterium]
MKPLHRKVIFIAFVVIFLVTAPLVVLYTAGYRYNFRYGRVQKTGILVISSSPRRAQIAINGKIEKKTTPARIEKILAGDYEIILVKDGYHNWQKKLPVFDNSTTFAEDVILWKNLALEKISDGQIMDWLESPDQEKIAWLDGENKLVIFNTDDGKSETASEFDPKAEVKILAWSNTSKKLLVRSDNRFLVLDSGAAKLKEIPSGYAKMKWDIKNDNLLYGSNAKGVWQYDLFNGRVKLMSAAVDDFLLNGKYIYFLQKRVVVRQTLSNPSEKLTLANDFSCVSCSFVDKKTSKLMLLDSASQNLFFLDPENKDKAVSAKAKDVFWLSDNSLLFYNDFELWIFDLNKKEPELVTRLGSPINSALWHPLGRHLIFASDNKIQIIELDNREMRSFTTLASTDGLTRLSLDSKGKNLFLAQKDGVFKLNIR